MNEHRKWGDRTWREMTVAQMVAEHDKTVQAWQDSQAELDRIGKINDSMCDTIAEMEKWMQETFEKNNRLDRDLDEARRALKSTIRVPFSDSQIEAMAKAAHDCRNFRDEQFPQPNWAALHDDLKAKWRAAIRAALAAGGLEPCAVPEYKPEDVALRPERASDEELANCMMGAAESFWFTNHTTDMLTPDYRRDAVRIAAAVRARVEAPLLAEIAEMKIHCDGRDAQVKHLECVAGKLHTDVSGLEDMVQRGNERWARVVAERDTLKARVAELEEGLVARTNTRLMDELAALRAELEAERERSGRFDGSAQALSKTVDDQRRELEAVKAERDGLQKRNDTQAGQLKHIDGEISPLMSEVSRLKAELEAVTEGLIEAKRQRDELACKLIAKNPSEPVYGGWHLEDGHKIVPNCELSGNTGELPAEPVSDTYKLGELLVIFQKAKAVNGWESDGLLAVMNHIKSLPQPTCHEPTGWELDVTAKEIHDTCTTRLDGYQAVIDLCRSRIRPTFGCPVSLGAETRKVKVRWPEAVDVYEQWQMTGGGTIKNAILFTLNHCKTHAAFAHFRTVPCQECAKMKEQRKAFRRIVLDGAEEVRNRIDAARAALEDE